jgi:hypothetical protein
LEEEFAELETPLDGNWIDMQSMEQRATIKGGHLIWRAVHDSGQNLPQMMTALLEKSSTKLAVMTKKGKMTGELREDGNLWWDDNDVWTKAPPMKAETQAEMKVRLEAEIRARMEDEIRASVEVQVKLEAEGRAKIEREMNAGPPSEVRAAEDAKVGSLLPGLRVEATEDFETDDETKLKKTIEKGQIGIVYRVDAHGDAVISFDSIKQRKWVKRCQFHCLQALPILEPGTLVRAKEDFESDTVGRTAIGQGTRGRVKRIDDDGDAFIQFHGIEEHQWVFQRHFGRLQIEAPEISKGMKVEVTADLLKLELCTKEAGMSWPNRSNGQLWSKVAGMHGEVVTTHAGIANLKDDKGTEYSVPFYCLTICGQEQQRGDALRIDRSWRHLLRRGCCGAFLESFFL